MKSSNRFCHKGITLVDLIFALGCIGFLVAAGAPSLQSVLGLSRKTVCLDRMRTIGQASGVYSAADAGNMAIPVHRYWDDPFFDERERPVGAYEWGGKSGVGWSDFRGPPASVNSAYGTVSGFGPATRPLNETIYKGGFRNYAPNGHDSSDYNRIGASRDTQLELNAFRCPADDGPPDGGHCPDWVSHPELTSFDYYGTSFAANVFMISTVGGGLMYSNSPYLRPLDQIADAARTLMYEENIGRWAWAAKRELDQCNHIGEGIDPGPTKSIRGWHGKNWTYNRTFADGHAETQALFIEGTDDAEGYANHYYSEYVENLPQYPEAPGLTNEELNQIYRCIIIRGDGWQKDTFPAELVPTGKHWSGEGRPSYEHCVQESNPLRRSGSENGGVR